MLNRKEIIENGLFIINKDSEKVPFKQNYVQDKIDTVKERLAREGKPAWIIILKARQEGCSAKIEADWLADCITHDNLNCVVISHEKESTKRLLRRVHYYIETSKFPIETNKQSEYEISFPETNSWFYIGTAGAKAFGRGDTVHRVHFSEWAFYSDDSVVDGLLQSVPNGGEVVAESTANGFGNRFQIEWEKAKRGDSKFYSLFFSWADNPEYRIKDTILNEEEITEEEKFLMERYNLDIQQIGWRREKIKEFPTIEKFKQEYPLTDREAFLHSGVPAFSPSALEAYHAIPPQLGFFKDSENEVIWEPNDKGWWRRWATSEPGYNYYTFCDPAEGLDPKGGDPDYTAIDVIDQNLNQVAQLQRRIPVEETAKQLSLAGRYYNQSFTGIERNGPGLAVITRFSQIYPEKRIYKQQTFEKGDRQETDKLGWVTNVKTRDLLIEDLNTVINEHSLILKSKWTVDECFSFVRNDKGKYEAQQGAHDDLVISIAGAYQMWLAKPRKVNEPWRPKREAKKKVNPYYNAE